MLEETKPIVFGYVPSVLDGTEQIINEENYKSLPLPSSYSYLQFMSPIMNQGSESTCVPHSISAAYDYYNAMMFPATSSTEGKFSPSEISIHQIYNAKTNYGPGMSYKEALEFCKNFGVVSEKEYLKKDLSKPRKIYNYAKVVSYLGVKQSIVINGPVMIATYVRDLNSPAFWRGTNNYGGHATCLIGYDDAKEAFLLRNSWGTKFGNGGYVWFPYKDFKNILEAWTIII